MLSAFSEQAPRDIKVAYAFRIYGKLNGFRIQRIRKTLGERCFPRSQPSSTELEGN